MTPFQKGVLEGYGCVVGMVCLVGLGMALCSGVVGLVVSVMRWMLGILHLGGCA